jgi:MFS family permease
MVLTGSIVVVDTMFFVALTPLLPGYAEDYGLSKAGAGALQAAYPLGVLVGSIPSGYIAARFGVKPTAVFALLLIAGTSIAFGFAGSIAVLDATRFVQGIGSACAWTAAFAWLIAVVPAERRGQSIGVVLGLAIGGAMFGPVLGALAAVLGTAPVFGTVGVLALLVAAAALATDAPQPGERQSIRRLWEALLNRRIVGGLWLIALPALLFGTLSVLAPLRLSDLGVAAVGIGAVFLTATVCEAVLSPLMGHLADRRGRRYPITIGLLASAGASVLLPWPQAAIVFAACTVLAASAFGTFWAPAMSFLSDTADHIGLEVAWVFALANLAWAPGQAIGAAASGVIAHATSDAVPYFILCAFCLGTLVAVSRA